MVGAFLEEHPDTTVVNIAFGLDTRVYRLDNDRFAGTIWTCRR